MTATTTTTAAIACEVCGAAATCRTDATDASPALNRCDDCARETCGAPAPLGILAQAEAVETEARERPAREAAAAVADARTRDERVTERELLTACTRAVAAACRALSHDEREDMAAALAEAVARKAGAQSAPAHVRGDERAPLDWTPPRRMIAHGYLTRRAAYLWTDHRRRLIAGRADARSSVLDQSRLAEAHWLGCDGTLEGEEARPSDSRSILAAAATAAGHPAPAPENVDAPAVCAALGVSATAADAIRAAMSGWGSALDLARALDVSHESARARLSRGRAAIRRAYPDPRTLLAALGDALADAPDPERVAERVRLSAAERAAEDAVTAVARSPRHVGGHRSHPAVTTRAARRNLRSAGGRPVIGPAPAALTYCGRVWRERVAVAAPWRGTLTREDLIREGAIVPAA
jgi:hypothetical protein